jgi:hypothetical protein
MTIDTPLGLLIFVLVGLVLPLLVDLVTKRLSSSVVKSMTLLALSLITGVLTEWLAAMNQGVTFDWVSAVYGAAISFVVGTVSFFGLAAPIGLSGYNGAIQKHLPGGIGSTATVAQATLADVDTPATDPLVNGEST